jgi:hypothetical protein
LLGLLQASYSETPKYGAVEFEIPVIGGAERYLELMEHPAYLVVALENNGITASRSGKLNLVSEERIQSNERFSFYFHQKKGTIYFYNAVLEWDTPIKHFTFDVPIQVDTVAFVKKGTMRVIFNLPMGEVFPDQLTNRIKEKIEGLTDPNIQKLILANFDELMKKQGRDGSIAKLKSQLMFQAYNRQIESVSVASAIIREPGDAESFSDQVYFFGTLGIWLICPMIFLGLYKYQKYRLSKNRKVDEV